MLWNGKTGMTIRVSVVGIFDTRRKLCVNRPSSWKPRPIHWGPDFNSLLAAKQTKGVHSRHTNIVPRGVCLFYYTLRLWFRNTSEHNIYKNTHLRKIPPCLAPLKIWGLKINKNTPPLVLLLWETRGYFCNDMDWCHGDCWWFRIWAKYVKSAVDLPWIPSIVWVLHAAAGDHNYDEVERLLDTGYQRALGRTIRSIPCINPPPVISKCVIFYILKGFEGHID